MPVTSARPQAVPLSVALREGTREEHQRAERSGFVGLLLAGRLDRAAYADLAAQQLVVYRALEAAGRRLDDVGGLVFAELERVPTIERDLTHLYGADWSSTLRVLPATQAYADRLAAVGDRLPQYAAHAYTRYLGDLSGGQIIKRMLQRHYGFTDDGIAFYDFPQIHRLKPFKDVYRERLDGLDLDEDARALVVEEARAAFRLNEDVFGELGAVHVR